MIMLSALFSAVNFNSVGGGAAELLPQKSHATACLISRSFLPQLKVLYVLLFCENVTAVRLKNQFINYLYFVAIMIDFFHFALVVAFLLLVPFSFALSKCRMSMKSVE